MNRLTVRERRLIASLGTLACVLGVGGLYLKHEAANRAWAEGRTIKPYDSTEPTEAQKEADKTLVEMATDKAKMFREKFQPWALAHKALIQKMLDAGPTDMVAYHAVLDALPRSEMKAGFDIRDFDGRATPPFAWAGAGKGMTRNDPGVQAWLRKSPANAKLWDKMEEYGQKYGPKRAAESFAQTRDLCVATSVNSGRYTIHLYASGRISKTYYTGKAAKPGRYNLDMVETEIVPPYDFLRPRVLFNKDADADSSKGA